MKGLLFAVIAGIVLGLAGFTVWQVITMFVTLQMWESSR